MEDLLGFVQNEEAVGSDGTSTSLVDEYGEAYLIYLRYRCTSSGRRKPLKGYQSRLALRERSFLLPCCDCCCCCCCCYCCCCGGCCCLSEHWQQALALAMPRVGVFVLGRNFNLASHCLAHAMEGTAVTCLPTNRLDFRIVDFKLKPFFICLPACLRLVSSWLGGNRHEHNRPCERRF